MATQSTSEFFALLQKSGVFDASEMDSLQQEFSDVNEARALARKLVDKETLTEWQAKLLMSGRHKLKVGAYVLRNRMPKQPIGDRFVALHQQLERNVDVLIFPSRASKNEEVFKHFLTKAAEVAELNHPNLLQLYDIDQDGSRYYLVFEHDEGQALQNIESGSLSAEQIAGIAKQCLSGIAFAHDRGIMHGKIDESQIRVRGKRNEKVSLRNMGLAHLLGQLADTSMTANEFDIEAHPTDDINTIGKISKALLARHLGQPKSESEKSLNSIFDQIYQASSNSSETTRRLTSELDEWLSNNQTKPASPSAAGTGLVKADSKEIATTPSKRTPSKTALSKSPAKKKTQPVQKDSGNRNRVVVIAASVLGLCGLAAAIYFGMTGGGGSEQAKATTDSGRSEIEKASRKSATAPVVKTNKVDDKAPKWTPPSDDQIEAATKNTESGGIAATIDQSATKKPPQEETATQEESSPQEFLTPIDSGVSFAGAEGWPLISWEDAKAHVGKDVVVYGLVSTIAGTAKDPIIKLKGSRSFVVLVDKTDWEITKAQLSREYDDTKVLVKGRVSLLESKDQARIVISSSAHIKTINVLPEFSGRPRLVSGTPNSSPPSTAPDKTMPNSTDATASATPVAPTGPFAKVGSTLGLTEWTRGTTDHSIKQLAEIDAGEIPLGISLRVPEEASNRDVFFEIVRDEQTRRRWEIYFSQRKKDADKSKYVVGEFLFEESKLGYRWKEGAEFNGLANQLRNCLVDLQLDGRTKTVLLRETVTLDPIEFSGKNASVKQRLELRNLPDPKSIAIEFLPYSEEAIGEQLMDMGTELTVEQKEIEVLFDKEKISQFFRVLHSAEIGPTIKLESKFQLSLNGQTARYSPKALTNLEQTLVQSQARKSEENRAAIAFEAPDGQKRDHNRRKKEISAELDAINAKVAAFQIVKPKITEVLGQKIRYRVLYNVGELQFEMAKTKGEK